MKVAYLSDIHLETCRPMLRGVLRDNLDVLPWLGFPKAGELDADVLVVAGDVHPLPYVQAAFKALLERAYDVPVVMPKGNHDYWYGPPPWDPVGEVITVKGKTIASCTLWTFLTDKERRMSARFSDFENIKGLNVDHWNALHIAQKDFLRACNADVIVTHHAPSLLSCSAQFKGHDINGFFLNDLDFRLFPTVRLWVHGHVHSEHDYTLPINSFDQIRVVCNPSGYPHETDRIDCAVKVVEVP